MLCALLLLISPSQAEAEAAKALAERVLGERAKAIHFQKIIGADDAYEVVADGKQLTIAATSGSAMTRGLYAFLRTHYQTRQRTGPYPRVESVWPDGAILETFSLGETDFKGRAGFRNRRYASENAFGFLRLLWDWPRWEKEIDWLALHGINEPFALVGQEAVWQRLWLEEGLTDSEARSILGGPTRWRHQDGELAREVGRPIPQSWIDGQVDLQKRILRRMRLLGMSPVLPEFSGQVPDAWVQRNPTAKLVPLDYENRPLYRTLSSTDPAYARLRAAFASQYAKVYGVYEPSTWARPDRTRLLEGSQSLYNPSGNFNEIEDATEGDLAWLRVGVLGAIDPFAEEATDAMWKTGTRQLVDRNLMTIRWGMDTVETYSAWLGIQKLFFADKAWRGDPAYSRSPRRLTENPQNLELTKIADLMIDFRRAKGFEAFADRDTLDIARFAIGNAIDTALYASIQDLNQGREPRFEKVAFELMEGLDNCLATVEEYRLEFWVSKVCESVKPSDAPEMERLLRSRVAYDPELGHGVVFSGALRHLYLPRWKLYMQRYRSDESLRKTETPWLHQIRNEVNALEAAWVKEGVVTSHPVSDTRAELKRLLALAATVKP